MLAPCDRPRVEPGPGQESVWDYPCPPAIVATDSHVVVVHAGVVVADSTPCPPPARDQPATGLLHPTGRRGDGAPVPHQQARSFCEWKGAATYWAPVQVGDEVVPDAAWSYEPAEGCPSAPSPHHLAFYPQRLHECSVDGERAQPNPGGFYGGWITSKVVGPFKGAAGPSTGDPATR